jgi:very-short-patch-repair endonuclease
VPTPPVPPRVRRPTDRRTAQVDGITDWHLRHRDVVRISRDTYLPPGAARQLRKRIDAVLLGAPADAIVSHFTAAALWRFEVPLVADDGRVHLSVPPESRVRSRADRRIYCSRVPEPETRALDGLRVTSPSRTWIDLAGFLPPGALLAVTDQMLERKFPADELPRILARSPGRRGVATARRILPAADGKAGSPMESVLRWLIHEAGLPRPVLQYVIRDAVGRFLAQVDLAWPEHRVVVEFDGNVHRDRRVFVEDLRRQNGIVLADWRVLRFSSADVLGRSKVLLATLRSALGLV